MDGNREVIDLMKAKPTPLFRRVAHLSKLIEIKGQQIPVPSAEAVLAMKLASMFNPLRKRADRLQDGADFARVIEATVELDVKILTELGDLLYAGGGEEILQMVDAIKTGKPLEL